MKRKIVFFSFLSLLFLSPIFAQKEYPSTFINAQKLFEEKKYDAVRPLLASCDMMQLTPAQQEECCYMNAVTAAALQLTNTMELISTFTRAYPLSHHIDNLRFIEGEYLFESKRYGEALAAYANLDINRLPVFQQEQLFYKSGLSNLYLNKDNGAREFFTIVEKNLGNFSTKAQFYLGYLDLKAGDTPSASTRLLPLKDNAAFEPEVSYYIAQIYLTDKQYEKALNLGLTSIEKSPQNNTYIDLCRVIGESYFFLDNYDETINWLQKYQKGTTNPTPTSQYYLGVAYYLKGEYQTALPYLENGSAETNPNSANCYLYIGNCYLKLDNKKSALLAFSAAANNTSDIKIEEIALYNYAMLLNETSFAPFDEAVTVMEKFLNKFPLSSLSDAVNSALVEVYLSTNNYNSALSSITKIKTPSPIILAAKQRLLFQKGTTAFTNNQKEEAAKLFAEIINIGDYDKEIKAQAYFWQGEVAYRNNDLSNATTGYTNFLKESKEKDKSIYTLAYYNLGYCYFKQNQYSYAIQNFSSFINLNKGDNNEAIIGDCYNRLGDCYYYGRNWDSAHKYYKIASTRKDKAAEYAIYQLAFVAGAQRDYNEKIRLLQNLINKFPQSSYADAALYEEGYTYILLQKENDATRLFSILEKEYPQSPYTRKASLQLAMIAANANQIDKAIVKYKELISKYLGSEESRVAAEDLKSIYIDRNDIAGYASYIKSLGGTIPFDATEQDSLTYLSAEKTYLRGNTQAAKESLTTYMQSFDNPAYQIDASYYLGLIYLKEGNTTKALSYFDVVLRYPDSRFGEETLEQTAEIYFNQKNYEKALISYQQLAQKTTNQTKQLWAQMGAARSQFQLNKWNEVIATTSSIITNSSIETDTKAEFLSMRAKAYHSIKAKDKEIADLTTLAEDVRTSYGAEANYLLGQHYYDIKAYSTCEKRINQFIEKGTPHSYWLARGFIVLADSYIAQKQYFQAKQYLLSLQSNYQENDDITILINERMKKIAGK